MHSRSALPVLLLGRGGDIDGQQRQLLYLATGLAQRSFFVTAAVSEPGGLLNELKDRGIDSLVACMSPWRSLRHVVARYRDAGDLLAVARERNARIVHAQDVWRAEYAYFVARKLGIASVVHVRGPLSKRDIHKHRLRLADTLIAIAQRYVDDLAAAGIDPARIVLIDDAVDLELFAPDRAEPSFMASHFGIKGSPIIGLVGRIDPDKRVRDFVEIVGLIPPHSADRARFVVIGDSVDRSYRRDIDKALDRLRLGDRVHFPGRCPSGLMPRLLSSLDLLVTLSGGSIMFEAMAMGKPVLSIRSDGRHSQHTRHGETAWCVDGDDPPAAAHALAALINDTALRERLGHAGREWVTRHLSSQTMVMKLERVYEKLAG
jgi:glycosyltransferase involved in cell wall biosynthesis